MSPVANLAFEVATRTIDTVLEKRKSKTKAVNHHNSHSHDDEDDTDNDPFASSYATYTSVPSAQSVLNRYKWVLIVGGIVLALLLVCCCVGICLCIRRSRKKKAMTASVQYNMGQKMESQQSLVSNQYTPTAPYGQQQPVPYNPVPSADPPPYTPQFTPQAPQYPKPLATPIQQTLVSPVAGYNPQQQHGYTQVWNPTQGQPQQPQPHQYV